MDALVKFQKEKDDLFSHNPDSPLTFEQKMEFKGLNYLSPNPALRLETTVREFSSKETISIPATMAASSTIGALERSPWKPKGRRLN